jgi:type I restriction enzyme S subunit
MSEEKNIPDGWVETTLGKLVKTNKESIDNNYPFSEIYYLDTGSITEGKIEELQHFELINAPSRAKRKVNEGDIIYSTVRPNQKHYGYIENPLNNLIVSTGFTVINSINADSSKYLYYWITQNTITTYLHQIAEQSASAYPSIKPSDIEKLKIILPKSTDEQKSIASILTSFDNKIELLQAQNKTLEETAQTIFTEWFGKYSVDDELPEGWRVGKLEEVIEFINGYAFKSNDLLNEPEIETLKVFKMGDIKKGGGFNPSKTKSYFKKQDAAKLSKYILKNGDLLMCMTDMKDAISLLGHTALMIYDDEYIVNQRVGLIRAKNDINIDYPYLYLLTNEANFISDLRGRSNSGVQVNLSTEAIKQSEIIIADKDTNLMFNNLIKPLFDKIKTNTEQIKSLTTTREELLPRLMSGEIRVNEFKA